MQQHLEQLLGLGLELVYFKTPQPSMLHPKNEKLDLGMYQHLQQLFRLGWVTFNIPLTKHVTPKNEKLDLGM